MKYRIAWRSKLTGYEGGAPTYRLRSLALTSNRRRRIGAKSCLIG